MRKERISRNRKRKVKERRTQRPVQILVLMESLIPYSSISCFNLNMNIVTDFRSSKINNREVSVPFGAEYDDFLLPECKICK